MIKSASTLVRRWRFAPRPVVQVESGLHLRRLGSDYGGWKVVDTPQLRGATVVSAGLGEDASFDVEFARAYSARVLMVDPTPRAIQHYEQIRSAIGRRSQHGYVSGGTQPIEAYPLDAVSAQQLVLVPQALYTGSLSVRFFAPPDPSHVSHSISNWQHDGSKDTPFIEVPATTLQGILDSHEVSELALLKLDIEGAEVDVLPHVLDSGTFPEQILVEFDELLRPSRVATQRYIKVHDRLVACDYLLLDFDGRSNFLYARRELVDSMRAAS